MSLRLPPGTLYGQTLRSQKVGGFELSERVYPPRYSTPKHSHKQALFCFVMQGNYSEKYGRKARECRPANLLFHPAEEQHAEHFHDSGGRSFVIEMDPTWLKVVSLPLKMAEEPSDFYGGVHELVVRKLYKEFIQMDEASAMIIEGLMLELLGEASRCCSQKQVATPPRWLQQARELLRSRFAENLTLAEVAKNVGVHPVHLAQMFHKTYRLTVGDYVRTLRIEYACHELVASEKPIVEIALAAGFCDQSHFTRTFKRSTGAAPSQYRESLRRA
ncbi:MAG TPA: AraC family transcriptional regulator [Blastocatellia bacterium]|nr:AraC family transcriptional regulator [Blastocatellia bacterium]